LEFVRAGSLQLGSGFQGHHEGERVKQLDCGRAQLAAVAGHLCIVVVG